jgi:hypothetical protein
MSSATKLAKNDATSMGTYRCAECGAIFDSREAFREHRASTAHHSNSRSLETDLTIRLDGPAQSGKTEDHRIEREEEPNHR